MVLSLAYASLDTHNSDKNSHHGKNIGNKNIYHEGQKNSDHKQA